MIAKILGWITVLVGFGVFLTGATIVIRAIIAYRMQRLANGFFILLGGALLIYLSAGCYREYTYFDLNTGRTKTTYEYFGLPISDGIKRTKLYRIYRSCNGKISSPRWLLVGQRGGPLSPPPLYSTESISIASDGSVIGNFVHEHPSLSKEVKCTIVNQYFQLINSSDLSRSEQNVSCFRETIWNRSDLTVKEVKQISNECRENE